MKKKKQSKENKGKKKKSHLEKQKDKENLEKEIPKEIGVFNDFLVYEKEDKIEELNSDLSKLESDFPLFLNIKSDNSNQKESRFSNLFKEILENDKKMAMENQKEEEKEVKTNSIKEDEKEIKKSEELNINQDINIEKNKDNFYNNNYFLYSTTFSKKNKFDECNIPDLSATQTLYPMPGNFYQKQMSISSNSSWPYGRSTNDTSVNTMFTGLGNSFSNKSRSSFDTNKTINNEAPNTINNNLNSINENKIYVSEKNTIFPEKNFDPFVNIQKILSLEDKRTTMMIKNIPNKFTRELLLSTIDQNFKGTYDLFILPTDGNRNKNFGYSFINFTNSYFIPYFYFMFNDKKWSSTNSKKICEITYSKVQGKTNLISYYANKIIFYNNVKEVTNDQKYIIPNDYKKIFIELFPKQIIEEYNFYFITKIPL